MQKKLTTLLTLVLNLVFILLPLRLTSQATALEPATQQHSTESINPVQSELLPVEDTPLSSFNSIQDPLTAFDEPRIPEQETTTSLLPLDADAEPLSPMDAQGSLSAIPLDQSPFTPSITHKTISSAQVISTKKAKKLSHKVRREKRRKEKRERKAKQAEIQKIVRKPDASLDFDVENKTGKTVYITCFAYMKKRPFTRWCWDKSAIYKIDDDKTTTIAMHYIEDEQDRTSTYGYLAVMNTQKEAEEVIYELLPDRNKLELDLLIHLAGKKVVLEVQKYGMLGEYFDYDFVRKKPRVVKPAPELDFVVENRTGKTIHVTCFAFQKKAKGTWLAEKTKAAWTTADETRDDMSVWYFDKTPIITLNPGESGVIDVDTIVEVRDRSEVKGYLAIFDEDELPMAENAIYELLEPKNKLELGKLAALKDKKVVIDIERYGAMGDIIDFTSKPVSRIDFTKLDRSKVTKRSRLYKETPKVAHDPNQ